MFSSENIQALSKLLPQIALIALVASLAGYFVRSLFAKPQPVKAAPSSAPAPKDRSKTLAAALEKAKAAQKELKAELDALKTGSVSKEAHESAVAATEAARKSLEAESKRAAAIEADLKKAQDTIRSLNGRANDADKARKDREFALENELSKARGELALLHARPDDTSALQTEIERLRESVAVTTRFAGELRKREAIALENLARLQSQLANQPADISRAASKEKAGAAPESDKVAAARAEVARLNALREIEPPAAPVVLQQADLDIALAESH